MRTSAVLRLLVFAALVGYLTAMTIGSQFAVSPPGALYDVWYSATPLIGGLALSFAAGLYIGRWWAVLGGFAPLAALGALELSGHVAPWHDAGPPLTQLVEYGLWYAVSTVVTFWLLPIAAGVALRKGLGPRPQARLTH
jgi:hypothetical protein